MNTYSYFKVNAFTEGNSLGNPASFLLLGNEDLSPASMLAFAKQQKDFVSEVVFCQTSDHADCKLTYYSSECEVDFCGHGTIATMYQYIKEIDSLRNKPVLTIDTNKKGQLVVYNRIDSEGAIYIAAPKPVHLPITISASEVASHLSISENYIHKAYPIEVIDAGLKTLLVPLTSLNKEVEMLPSESDLKKFCLALGVDIIVPFCLNTFNPMATAHSRVFATRFGYLEDPATGSGNSALANYLLDHHLWDGTPILIEQGGKNCVFNSVRLRTKDSQVLFGGSCTLRIRGEYYL